MATIYSSQVREQRRAEIGYPRARMPSKTAQHLAFFFVLLVSAGLHRYVFGNFKRVLLRDFPRFGTMLVRIAIVLFIAMDLPFAFIYLRWMIHGEHTTLTRILLYPFSIWQALMMVWAIVLVPFSLWRRRERLGLAWTRDRVERIRKSRILEDEELILEVAPE